MREEYLFYISGLPDVYENEKEIIYWNELNICHENCLSPSYVIFQKDRQQVRTNITDIDVELTKAIVKKMIDLKWIDIEELEELL